MKIKRVYNGFIKIDQVNFTNTKGDLVAYECARRPNSVGCLLVDRQKKVFTLIKQSRVPVVLDGREPQFEVVAGLVDYGENAIEAIIREVREETGYVLDESHVHLISSYYTNIGVSDEEITLFVAFTDEAEQTKTDFDSNEDIQTIEIAIEEVLSRPEDFTMCSKTTLCLMHYSLAFN